VLKGSIDMTFSSSMRLVSRTDGSYLIRSGTVCVLEILKRYGLLWLKNSVQDAKCTGFFLVIKM
jgi:hypothetical protein